MKRHDNINTAKVIRESMVSVSRSFIENRVAELLHTLYALVLMNTMYSQPHPPLSFQRLRFLGDLTDYKRWPHIAWEPETLLIN